MTTPKKERSAVLPNDGPELVTEFGDYNNGRNSQPRATRPADHDNDKTMSRHVDFTPHCQGATSLTRRCGVKSLPPQTSLYRPHGRLLPDPHGRLLLFGKEETEASHSFFKRENREAVAWRHRQHPSCLRHGVSSARPSLFYRRKIEECKNVGGLGE
jgi:hypothetical protein